MLGIKDEGVGPFLTKIASSLTSLQAFLTVWKWLPKNDAQHHIISLKTAKECFDTLTNLYEKKAPSQKRVLKKRISNIEDEQDEGVDPFFTKIVKVRDQLTTIGITVDDDDLVQTVVDGLPNSWEAFLAPVSGREISQASTGMIAWKKKEEF